MKVLLPVCCGSCGETIQVEAIPTFDLPDVKCSCGATMFGAGEIPLAPGLLSRAQSECRERQEYNLAIIIAAMAVDCELSRLYVKWRRIEEIWPGPTDEGLESELRDMGGFVSKISSVSLFLTGKRADEFISTEPMLEKWSDAEVSKTTFTTSLSQKLFWPRNRIMHFGYLGSSQADAERALSVGFAGVYVLSVMDHVRRVRLEKAV